MKKENLFNCLAVAAIIYLFFMWGALTVQLKIFPYSLLERSLIGLSALQYEITPTEEMTQAKNFHLPNQKKYIGLIGVTKNTEPNLDKYIIYANSTNHIIRLINSEGEVIHKWDVNPISKLEQPKHITRKLSPYEVAPRDIYLFPSGELLVLYEAYNQFHNNYGIAKFDKDSNVLWFHQSRNHHYIDIDPEGNIYTLSLDIRTKTLPYLSTEHLKYPTLEDTLEILDKNGNLKKRLSIIEILSNSETGRTYLESTKRSPIDGDHIHPNTASYITAEQAIKSKIFEEGQVIISSRETDTIFVIDPIKETLIWLGKGSWIGQHHTIMSPQGEIIMFDNQGAKHKKTSRILSFNPTNNKYNVLYEGNDQNPFYSPFCSSLQLLPDNHLFITSHHNGRMFEIDENKNIIWEYFIPIRDPNDPNKTASVYAGKRYTKNELPFLFEKPE